MVNDKAILYNAKLKELKSNLKEISKIKIKIYDFNIEIENLEKEVETKIKESYSSFYTNETLSFLNESLNKIYTDAIKIIDKINNYINNEYSSYYNIYSKCLELESKLDDNDINELVIDANILLKKIKETTSLDFNSEKELVDMVYNLVYRIIKKEIILNSKSELLHDVKMDEIDSIFLAEIIKKDIEKVKDNENIKKIINELNSKGYQSKNYVDEKLILYLIFDNDKELVNDLKDKISNKLNEYQDTCKKISDNEKEIDSLEKKVDKLNAEVKKISINRFIGITKLSLSVGIASLLTFGTIKLSKLGAINTYYMTTTETYDFSSKEINIEEDYKLGKNEEVTITEYTPWERINLTNNYERNVTTYKISNDEIDKYENIEDYLKIDASKLIQISIKGEITNLLIENAAYKEKKYVVVRIKKDLDDYINKYSGDDFYVNIIFIGVLSSIIYVFIFFDFWHNKKLNEYFESNSSMKLKLKDIKKLLLELKNDRKTLESILKNLSKKIEVEYEGLPSVIKEDKELKEKILRLDNKS